MRTETKLLPMLAKRKRGIVSPPEAETEIILRNISASTGKVEKKAFHSLEDSVGSRASALSQPSPSPSECSFVSGADVLHSCSHGSERTISECEGGSGKKKKQRYCHRHFCGVLVGLYTN